LGDVEAVTQFRTSAILFFAVRLAVAQPDPGEVLRRAALKVLAHVPNYTCVQTVIRDYYRADKGLQRRGCAASDTAALESPAPDRLSITDRLRLDVTMAEQREIFSWAGADNFEDASIDQVVRSGPIGSGAFAGFLTAAFHDKGAKLTFVSKSTVEGRELMGTPFTSPAPKANIASSFSCPTMTGLRQAFTEQCGSIPQPPT